MKNFYVVEFFTKEKQYAKKYDLTMEEIGNIQTCLYYALHIKDECYNERINHLCDWEVEIKWKIYVLEEYNTGRVACISEDINMIRKKMCDKTYFDPQYNDYPILTIWENGDSIEK